MAYLKAMVTLVIVFIFFGSAFAGNPKAVGDIVARDLKIPGLGWAGHVGIWTSESSVLEVLDKKTVIQKNSIKAFQKESAYWGAKYGRGKSQSKVIAAGWGQRDFSPRYTSSATWQEGSKSLNCVKKSKNKCLKQERVTVNAKFRCDTFVWYAYKKGINEDLLNGGRTILPRKIYNSMPKQR